MASLSAVAEQDADTDEWDLREDLAAAYRLAALLGWDDGISTHFSLRLPGPDHHFLINPFGTLFEEIRPEVLLRINLVGDILDGPPGARINKAGFTVHAGVHAARADAVCVLHCHTVAGVAIGAREEGLTPISGHAMLLYGKTGYHGYEGVLVDQDEVPRIVSNLGDNAALMLRNHGTLVAAPSLAQAMFLLFHLEKACQIQVAAGEGRLVRPNPQLAAHMQGQMDIVFADIADLFWTAMKRRLARTEARLNFA